MMKRFRKYAILCRLLGCFFIEGIWDRSITKARVRMISAYTLCTAAWILLNIAVSINLIGKLFLLSEISRSFTKSLLFLVNGVVMTKMMLNLGCMIRGPSKLLQFFRDSQAYEKSAAFAPFKTCPVQWRRRCTRPRKFIYLLFLVLNYGLVIRVPVETLVRGNEDWWQLSAMIGNIINAFTVLFYDAMVYVVLSSCSEVLADYFRAEVATLCGLDCRTRLSLHTCREIEKVRLNVSVIKDLKRSINEIWHPALAVWSAGLILIMCITVYAITAGDLGHPDVWMAMAYAAHTSISFMDIAILSQSLSDEAQKLKEAAFRMDMMEIAESCREQVHYLHDTIDPKSMCLTCAGIFRLNKALLVSMAGSIITYAVILVQTSDKLAEHVDVGSLLQTHV